MDAHLARFAVLAAALTSLGASYRTNNFVVNAPTPQLAEEIGQAAEKYRRELAVEWLGHEMRNWAQPCPITAQVADNLGAGGATSFVFEHGEVFGWRMTIQGSRVRILDSVLPHEVTHTIFATHFRQPLPRWADEGACTTVEHQSERSKQQTMLVEFLKTGRGIAFSRMFTMKEYPQDVMPLYSQGYSVARYLVAQGGKHKFLEFVGDGMKDENWTRAINQHYGITSLAALQSNWLDWVRKGSPIQELNPRVPALVAVKGPGPSDRDALVAPRERGASQPKPSDDAALADSAANNSSVYDRAGKAEDTFKLSSTSRSKDWRRSRREPAPDEFDDSDDEPASADEATQPAQRAPASHQVTRPQPTQGARQVILEWSRPYPGEAAGGERRARRVRAE